METSAGIAAMRRNDLELENGCHMTIGPIRVSEPCLAKASVFYLSPQDMIKINPEE